MSVTADNNSAAAQNPGSSSTTFTYTSFAATAGDYMVVFFSTGGTRPTITGVTFNGSAFNFAQIGSIDNATNSQRIQVWGSYGSFAATANVVVSVPSFCSGSSIYVATYAGVAQNNTDPIASFVGNTGTSATWSATVSAHPTDGVVLGAQVGQFSTYSATLSQCTDLVYYGNATDRYGRTNWSTNAQSATEVGHTRTGSTWFAAASFALAPPAASGQPYAKRTGGIRSMSRSRHQGGHQWRGPQFSRNYSRSPQRGEWSSSTPTGVLTRSANILLPTSMMM